MSLMLPEELVWVLNLLGFNWPQADEDRLRGGGVLRRVPLGCQKLAAQTRKGGCMGSTPLRGHPGARAKVCGHGRHIERIEPMTKLAFDADFRVDVRPEEWENPGPASRFYQGIYTARLNTIVVISFVPDVS